MPTEINYAEWSIANILSLSSIIIAIIGGCFAFLRWGQANKIKRAEFLFEITEKLRSDADLSDSLYVIDYSKKWYDDNFHGNQNEYETKMDNLFLYLSYICYLLKMKCIKKGEFGVVEYKLLRVLQSIEVQSYFWNIYHFSKKFNRKCSFQDLIDYGLDNKIIESKYFKNTKETIYPKYLNF